MFSQNKQSTHSLQQERGHALCVAVIRLSSFGDIVLSLKALREIAISRGLESSKNPIELIFITKEKFSFFVKELWDVIFPKSHEMNFSVSVKSIPNDATLLDLWLLAGDLRSKPIHLFLDFHSNLRSRLVMLFLWPHFCIRIPKPRVKEWLLFLGRKWSRRWISTRRWRLPLKVLSPLLKEHSFAAKTFLSPQVRVGIAMESAWSTKEWPAQNFFDTIPSLMNAAPHLKFSFTFLGENRETLPLPLISRAEILDLRGKTSLLNLISIFKNNLDILICNDSGLLHLAEILGVPCVAVFGPTTFELGFGPSHHQSRVAQQDLWCRPCSKTGRLCHRINRPQLCLSLVDVRNVVQCVLDVLA